MHSTSQGTCGLAAPRIVGQIVGRDLPTIPQPLAPRYDAAIWKGIANPSSPVQIRVPPPVERGVSGSTESQPETGAQERETGRVFLTDFGLAKPVATGSKLTRTGETLGTPAYMSPEQARGEVSSLTPATDTWSLGCVLYELLASSPAFGGETTAAVIGGVLAREPTDIRILRPDVPRGVERVLRASLSKGARDRYRDAAALEEDLDRVLRGGRPRLRLAGGLRRRVALAALAAGLAACAALTIVSRMAAAPAGGPPPGHTRSGAERFSAQAAVLRGSDPARAADLLARALAEQPGRDDWRVERGVLLWASGDGPGARKEWAALPADSPERPAARLYGGLEALLRFRGREAVGELEAARSAAGRVGTLAEAGLAILVADWRRARELLQGVEGWEASLLRATVEGEDPSGDRSLAVREFGAALEAGPPFPWIYNNRGDARMDMGDRDGAKRDFEEALHRDPLDAKARFNRGVARHGEGDIQGAVADYDEAIRLRPDYAKPRANRGEARRTLGDLAGALADLDEAIRLDPREFLAWSARGSVHLALDRFDKAEADFDRAIELDPRAAEGWDHRGNVRRLRGNLAGALADLDEAVRLAPASAASRINRAIARRRSGDPAGGRADLEEALRLDPAFPEAWLERAVLRRERGDLSGAVEDLDQALRLQPRLVEALVARALAKLDGGDPAGARGDLARALEIAPPGWGGRTRVEALLAHIGAGARGSR